MKGTPGQGPYSGSLSPYPAATGQPRGCQFISGDIHDDPEAGADSLKCGEPALPGRPYCAAHFDLTHKAGDDMSDRSEPGNWPKGGHAHVPTARWQG